MSTSQAITPRQTPWPQFCIVYKVVRLSNQTHNLDRLLWLYLFFSALPILTSAGSWRRLERRIHRRRCFTFFVFLLFRFSDRRSDVRGRNRWVNGGWNSNWYVTKIAKVARLRSSRLYTACWKRPSVSRLHRYMYVSLGNCLSSHANRTPKEGWYKLNYICWLV